VTGDKRAWVLGVISLADFADIRREEEEVLAKKKNFSLTLPVRQEVGRTIANLRISA
jgi:hypothetical protein